MSTEERRSNLFAYENNVLLTRVRAASALLAAYLGLIGLETISFEGREVSHPAAFPLPCGVTISHEVSPTDVTPPRVFASSQGRSCLCAPKSDWVGTTDAIPCHQAWKTELSRQIERVVVHSLSQLRKSSFITYVPTTTKTPARTRVDIQYVDLTYHSDFESHQHLDH